MNIVRRLISNLESTRDILLNLLKHIPEDLYTVRRLENKWSIHEQVCHLVDMQKILIDRFKQFENEEQPLIKTHSPPKGRKNNYC